MIMISEAWGEWFKALHKALGKPVQDANTNAAPDVGKEDPSEAYDRAMDII